VELPGRARLGGRALAGSLVAVAGIVSSAARSDYLAYFNPWPGKTQAGFLITLRLGLRQDRLPSCGGDFRPTRLHVQHCHVEQRRTFIHGIARDGSASALIPVTGWVAISAPLACALAMFSTPPIRPHAFDWIESVHAETQVARRSGSITFRLTLQRLMAGGQGNLNEETSMRNEVGGP